MEAGYGAAGNGHKEDGKQESKVFTWNCTDEVISMRGCPITMPMTPKRIIPYSRKEFRKSLGCSRMDTGVTAARKM
jgi:hypothetical protein